jgi:hypothetical protein
MILPPVPLSDSCWACVDAKKGKSMAEVSNLQLLDHELAEDELKWVSGVYEDFTAARAAYAGREKDFNPKETLREVLGRKENLLPTPMDLSGDGPWRNGRNNHGRLVACVFLKKIELHRHPYSRTDQFPMYVVGEADAFSLDDDQRPVLKAVTVGGQFHNPPNAPHAFLPKVGEAINDDWEIAFLAITPRNLREDTHKVSEETRAAYKQIVGYDAPVGV